MKNFLVKQTYINKVRETQKRSFETSLKQNRFWLSTLVNYTFLDRDPELILEYPELINTLDPKIVQDAASKYFDVNNYVQVILKPALIND